MYFFFFLLFLRKSLRYATAYVIVVKSNTYRRHSLKKTARKEQFPVHQHGGRQQKMEDSIADTTIHERNFSTVIVGQIAADHCRQYVTVQKCSQHTTLRRRVPVKFTVLRAFCTPSI